MNYVYLVINWLFGILFLLTGMFTIIESPLGGLSLILISLLLLPPIRKFVYSKIKHEFPTRSRGFLIVILLFTFGVFINISQSEKNKELEAQKAQETVEKIAAIKKQNIEYFNQNASDILSKIKIELEQSNYEKVILLSTKYLPSKNKKLLSLNSEAKLKLSEIKKAEKEAKDSAERKRKTKEILTKLKSIPSSNYERNKALYQQLVKHNPKVSKYRNKFNYYSNKIIEAREKERIKKEKIKKKRDARIAKFGEPPIKSAWDGSYRAVEQYLKRVANDPDSIKIDGCTEVYHTKKGWLVGCDYRGRNGFGGMVRQSNWFIIIHNVVIQQEKASAYKP